MKKFCQKKCKNYRKIIQVYKRIFSKLETVDQFYLSRREGHRRYP